MQRKAPFCLIIVIALTLTACGSRVERVSKGTPPVSIEPSPLTETPDPGLGEESAVPAPPVGADGASHPTLGGRSTRTSRPAVSEFGASRPSSPSPGGAGEPAVASGPAVAHSTSPGGTDRSPGGTDRQAQAGTGEPEIVSGETEKRSPAVIASAGTMSGPIGAVFFAAVQGLQVWVKYINSKGGVNGHPVRHIIYDDGGDPARHRAQLQEAIERENVIAFVQQPEAISGQGKEIREYMEAKRVPVIGGEGGVTWFYDSPMYFPQIAQGYPFFAIGTYGAAKVFLPEDKTKLATTTCVEAQGCADDDRIWAETAADAGFQHVYRARSSVTQPDYSAECLSARNAGAQVFMVALDPASMSRLALSCARQGYHPAYATIGAIVLDRMKDDPNLEGMVAPSNAFPYFQSGTPATDEFQRAMKRYGRNLAPGVPNAVGWTSGKLFERAAANLPEPPTSDAVLRGLWSLRDETLGGLTYPLTFLENQPAKPISCWFTLAIRNGSWMSPDGSKLQCH